MGAPAALMVAAGAPTPEVAAYDGLEAPLGRGSLAALVSAERPGRTRREGRTWRGPLDADGPLRARWASRPPPWWASARGPGWACWRCSGTMSGLSDARSRGPGRARRARRQRPDDVGAPAGGPRPRRRRSDHPLLQRALLPEPPRPGVRARAAGRRAAERRDHLAGRPGRAARAGARRGGRVGRRGPLQARGRPPAHDGRRLPRRARRARRDPARGGGARRPARRREAAGDARLGAGSRGRLHALGRRRELPLAGRPLGVARDARPHAPSTGRAATAATAPSSTTPTRPRSCAPTSASRWPTTRPCSRRSRPWRRRSTPAIPARSSTRRTSAASPP